LFQIIAEKAGSSPPKIYMPNWLLHLIGIVGDLAGSLGFKMSLSQENAWTATMYHWFDSSKAQRELDFKPSPAHIAIGKSVSWMKDHGLLNKK
jgi:dihydroflavonol-4-reductase